MYVGFSFAFVLNILDEEKASKHKRSFRRGWVIRVLQLCTGRQVDR